MAAHEAPQSLGFSRQEHWSGLPFPSPMHESEEWKMKSLSRAQPRSTPWTAAFQAPPCMGFSRQDYSSGVPLPSLIHHLGMSMCRVVSYAVGRRCFLWPVCFSWQNSVSLCPASFCSPRPNFPVTPCISWLPTFAFQSSMMKRTSFFFFFWC